MILNPWITKTLSPAPFTCQRATDRGLGSFTFFLSSDMSGPVSSQPAAVRSWHAVVASQDPALLDGLLADEVVFRSPAVFAPQHGKALTAGYLTSAMHVLGPSLQYIGEWHDDSSAVLEFEASLDGVYVQGVDMLRWNDEGKLVSFTVLVRPLRGLEKLIELMARQLADGQT
jgi:SnoaL-like domain